MRRFLIASLGTLALAAPATAMNKWQRHALRYITTSESRQQHVGRCHRLHADEHVCRVRLITLDSIFVNGVLEPFWFNGQVNVRHLHGWQCSYDPAYGIFPWVRC